MDLKSFTQAIEQIADEKGIAKERVFETIELALAAAYKRDYGERGQIVRAKLEPETGKVEVKQIKIVVDETIIKSEEEIAAEEETRRLATEQSVAVVAMREPSASPRDQPVEEKADGLSVGVSTETEVSADEIKKVRFNPEKHIMIEEARKIKSDVNLGDELEFPLEYHESFGRIAAQTAKQVIIQRIREAEREAVFDEFKEREGEVVSGLVQRVEGRNVFIDVGRTVGILPFEEQIPRERYRIGERLKVLITLVEKNPRGPGVFLSRSHPRLLKKLFEIEVPEVAAGTVEIKSMAREAGSRSKVAVVSHESGVDPVSSLVGQKGIRVSTVINELGGEKIDVIEWSEDPAEFVAHALSPAKVISVEVNARRREAYTTVPEDMLSLAIGRGGQNVRLAAKLTGWKIDVRPPASAEATASRPKETVDPSSQEPPAEPEEEQKEYVPDSRDKVIVESAIKEAEQEKPQDDAAPKEEKPKKKRKNQPKSNI
ncbi:MAG: transcription termination factor NusA [Candidatus Sungbacteria bacterium RIFCSPHIGHO2_02_FULL_47_11]|uniref:Transcription termination/antitermination protein NusA n=1 Tax=Candidatus Sungbacteria bacterium RIFCSPHIGHO2_02_FULL_47_11 TaxID=1802270 RepID=A0A1G2KNB8_9BACT|nr:MAG: transcription termination factor NusA [Candidatus Sungbacteria bacterium RIFCSPHIGHO2_02_FULL_47_11]